MSDLMGILDSCLFGSSDNATDPALSSVVIDDGEGGGGGGNSASKDLLSASLAQSGILDDAVGDGVVSLVGYDCNDYTLQDILLQVPVDMVHGYRVPSVKYRANFLLVPISISHTRLRPGYIWSARLYGPFLVDKHITGPHVFQKRFSKHYYST